MQFVVSPLPCSSVRPGATNPKAISSFRGQGRCLLVRTVIEEEGNQRNGLKQGVINIAGIEALLPEIHAARFLSEMRH
jgi:hypothetical protein